MEKTPIKNALVELTESLSRWCIDLGTIRCAQIREFHLLEGWTKWDMMIFMSNLSKIDYNQITEEDGCPGIIWMNGGFCLSRGIVKCYHCWSELSYKNIPEIPEELKRYRRFIEFCSFPY